MRQEEIVIAKHNVGLISNRLAWFFKHLIMFRLILAAIHCSNRDTLGQGHRKLNSLAIL